METNTAYKKASFWLRAAAYIIDAVILFVPILILILVTRLTHFNFPWIIRLIEFLIVSTYNVFFISRTGATIGKKLLKLKVVSIQYQDVSIKQVLLREVLGKFISQLIFGLGFVWTLGNGKRQTWHDKIAGTYVVKLNLQGTLIQEEDEKPKLYEKIIFILYSVFIVVSVLIGLFYAFVGRPIRVATASMTPTYKQGAYLLTQHAGTIKRGDVVIYTIYLKGKRQQLIKRVIALPGENVAISNGEVYINSKRLVSKFIAPNTKTLGGAFLPNNKQRKVSKYSYFVLGDNRTASLDSRDMGFVPARNITGKILMCYWNCK